MFLFDTELRSVIYIGLCFTVLFASDFTVTNMQKTLTNSITEDKPDYNIDGYVTLGLVYSVYGVFLWLAPPLISLTGPKLGLMLGSFGYVLYVLSFTLESVWVTYLGMVIGGIGGSVLWVSEGNYMVLTSSSDSLPRNIGIFWVLYSLSLVFGNLYAVFELEGKTKLDYDTRHVILYVLGGVAVLATAMFGFLPPVRSNKFSQNKDVSLQGPLNALKKTWSIFWKKEVLILLITFCYAGFQQSFGQGIYAPCLGFTKAFGIYAKQMVPLSGLVYGFGDLFGGLLQALVSKYMKRFKLWSSFTIIWGFLIQALAYILVYLNIPNNAVFGETEELAIIRSNIPLAIICSFLIGFGDSCLNTQIYPLLASLEPDFSAQTSALYKFTKSMAMALCFFCSPYLGLHIQLTIIFCVGIISTLTFVLVDQKFILSKGIYSPN